MSLGLLVIIFIRLFYKSSNTFDFSKDNLIHQFIILTSVAFLNFYRYQSSKLRVKLPNHAFKIKRNWLILFSFTFYWLTIFALQLIKDHKLFIDGKWSLALIFGLSFSILNISIAVVVSEYIDMKRQKKSTQR